MTAPETEQIFKLLIHTWATQRARMSKDDLRGMALAYAAGLGDLDFALTKAAVIRLAHTHEWIPTIAAIRDAVGIVVHGQVITGMEAWAAVHHAQVKYGSHRTPGEDFNFDDPITKIIVKGIGWREICASMRPDAIRDRFVFAYDRITKQERTEAQASPGAVTPSLPRAQRHQLAIHASSAIAGVLADVGDRIEWEEP
ncbi:MAG TPA: hypothetical protein VGM94_00730 [Galbitalea sp.]|jgi:hypothetical protein